jgi:putative colanic acid biosynthesis glycosyltransferase
MRLDMNPPPSRPALAVVTVTKNDLPGLLATRAGLRRQTCRDFEWLTADGGSSDGTRHWLNAHSDELSWWRSGPDLGVYDAMNRCLDRITADAVLFLNAGDTPADPDVIGRIVAALRAAPDAGFLYGDAIERQAGRKQGLKPARSHHLSCIGMFTHHQSMVYRASAIKDLRYDLSYPIGADYDFTLGVLLRCVRVVRLRTPICVFRDGGLSRRHAAQGRLDQARIRLRRYPIATLWSSPLTSIQRICCALRTLFPSAYAALRFRDIRR